MGRMGEKVRSRNGERLASEGFVVGTEGVKREGKVSGKGRGRQKKGSEYDIGAFFKKWHHVLFFRKVGFRGGL